MSGAEGVQNAVSGTIRRQGEDRAQTFCAAFFGGAVKRAAAADNQGGGGVSSVPGGLSAELVQDHKAGAILVHLEDRAETVLAAGVGRAVKRPGHFQDGGARILPARLRNLALFSKGMDEPETGAVRIHGKDGALGVIAAKLRGAVKHGVRSEDETAGRIHAAGRRRTEGLDRLHHGGHGASKHGRLILGHFEDGRNRVGQCASAGGESFVGASGVDRQIGVGNGSFAGGAADVQHLGSGEGARTLAQSHGHIQTAGGGRGEVGVGVLEADDGLDAEGNPGDFLSGLAGED